MSCLSHPVPWCLHCLPYANLVWTFEVVIKPLCLDGIQSGRKQQSNNQCVDFCWAVHKIGGNTKCYQWLQSDELRDSSCSSVNVDLEITMTSRWVWNFTLSNWTYPSVILRGRFSGYFLSYIDVLGSVCSICICEANPVAFVSLLRCSKKYFFVSFVFDFDQLLFSGPKSKLRCHISSRVLSIWSIL